MVQSEELSGENFKLDERSRNCARDSTWVTREHARRGCTAFLHPSLPSPLCQRCQLDASTFEVVDDSETSTESISFKLHSAPSSDPKRDASKSWLSL